MCCPAPVPTNWTSRFPGHATGISPCAAFNIVGRICKGSSFAISVKGKAAEYCIITVAAVEVIAILCANHAVIAFAANHEVNPIIANHVIVAILTIHHR